MTRCASASGISSSSISISISSSSCLCCAASLILRTPSQLQRGEQGHVELGSMLMGRDDAEGAAHHFDVAFRSARSLPVRCLAALPCRAAVPHWFGVCLSCYYACCSLRFCPCCSASTHSTTSHTRAHHGQELEVAAGAKELAAAQQRVATMLELPISQVAERLLATQSEIQLMQMQGGGAGGPGGMH